MKNATIKHEALNTQITDQPAVYVGTYGKYNDGSINGAWVDLTKVNTLSEFYEICQSIHADEADPEYMFQDFQGFPRSLYCESTMNEFFKVWEYVQENLSNYPIDAVWAYLDYGYDIENFEEAYNGEYGSETEFAEQLLDDTGYFSGVPDTIKFYFDYERFANDLFINDYNYINGYVFNRNI